MNRDELRTILKGKCVSDSACEAAIDEIIKLIGVVEQSEQLKCGNPNPPCSPNIKFGCLECCNCDWSE